MQMPKCNPDFLDCSTLDKPERKAWMSITHVLKRCDPTNLNVTYDYGLFADAFTNDVVGSPFMEKYLYCLWWGLRNLRYDHYRVLLFLFYAVSTCHRYDLLI